jgi:putative FmdB family regulatory protein
MPIYEYRCSKCGEFEVTQRITDKPLSKCPKCRSKVSKLISNTSFQLKGSGWYVTDYAGKSKGKDKPESSTSEPSKSDSGAAKTEASTKADSKPSSGETKGSSAAA